MRGLVRLRKRGCQDHVQGQDGGRHRRRRRARSLLNVQVFVQHHPARQQLIGPLVDALRPLTTLVVTDPQPDHPAPSPWRTYLACLHQINGDGHTLIVQDDAVPCRNLAAAVTRIAAAVPDNPVALFLPGQCLNTKIPHAKAVRQRRPYVRVHWRDVPPFVATLWPNHVARSFLDWALEHPRAIGRGPDPRADDGMAHAWIKRTRQLDLFLATVPSLVEHDDNRRSLIRDGNRPISQSRYARMFIGDNDPLDIDWSLVP